MFNIHLGKPQSASSINRGDRFTQTPLHFAAKSKQKDIVKLLLEHGADVEAVATKNRSVLHFLLDDNADKDENEEKDCLEILKLLLSKGAATDMKDSDEKTLLHLAAKNKQKDVIQILLSHLNDFVDHRDTWGNTALHILLGAITDINEEMKFIEIVNTMLQSTPSIICVTDKFGRTPLHIAVQNKQMEIVKILLPYYTTS